MIESMMKSSVALSVIFVLGGSGAFVNSDGTQNPSAASASQSDMRGLMSIDILPALARISSVTPSSSPDPSLSTATAHVHQA